MASACCSRTDEYIQPNTECLEEPQVTGLSIAEVRKSLAHLRRRWDETQVSQDSAPLYLCEEICLKGGQKIRADDFALKFVLTHHQKRRISAGKPT